MKTRGWLLAAIMAAIVIAPSYAMAQSDAGDMLTVDQQGIQNLWDNPNLQEDIAADVADIHGFAANSKQARTIRQSMIGSSNGEFLPQVAQSYIDAGMDGSGTATEEAYKNLFDPLGTGNGALGVDAISLTNSMTGLAGTAGVNSGLETAKYNSSIIHNRQEAIRRDMRLSCFDPCGSPLAGFANRIWATPFHNNITQRDKDNYTGYKYKMTGVAVGFEHLAGPMAFGAAFTYSRGDYEWRDAHDDNKINNYGGSIYAQYYSQSGFFAAFDGGFNYGQNKWKRDLNAITDREDGKNHTNSYWVGGEIGYDAKLGCGNFTLTPTVGLYWYEAKSSAFTTRTVGDPTNDFMRYGKMTKKSLLLPVELTASYDHRIDDCSSISVKASGGYTYNFKNKGADGWADFGNTGNEFGVRGMKSARSGWNASAGLNYNYKSLDFGVDYRYEGAKKYHNHSVSATVGVRF